MRVKFPLVSTPLPLDSEKKKGEAQPKSCFDLAENQAASSPWVGDHRQQGKNLRVKTLMGLERFEVDKTRAFSLYFPEIPEITEILEMGFTKE